MKSGKRVFSILFISILVFSFFPSLNNGVYAIGKGNSFGNVSDLNNLFAYVSDSC